ncbi:hypothetical protein DXG01_014979 [Tephrocybe rancida]|nr:hypothetical protein DXG01_014979 [Tephrocybe rancida]
MSTRQTPGASSSPQSPLAPSMNSRKRSTSEVDADIENSRVVKKPKRDDKKKRKRKKRKGVVTAAEPEARARSKSRSATVATQESAHVDAQIVPENAPSQDAQALQETKDPEEGGTSDRIPYADKGKGKAREESLPLVIESPEAQIARLQREIDAQRLLLRQHQSHTTQVHQALTCQICLDLLHKPFALAPCGHVVCYPCLVRWFTAPEAAGGPHNLEEDIPGRARTSHSHKKKNCPICRTTITERPVEVWGIKGMVTGLTRSGLVELPAPAPEAEAEPSTSTSDDPWRNIFPRANRRLFLDMFEPRPPRPPREGGEGLEDMGMYDADDGGIYRCIDCMHEIWRGVCTHCERRYPGHHPADDDEDDEALDFHHPAREFRGLLQLLANGPPGHIGAHADYITNSDSEDSVGMMFGEELDDDEDDEEDGIDAENVRHRPPPYDPLRPFAARIDGPFGGFFDLDHDEETGIAHIDEEVQLEGESGEESDGYESSFIDDDANRGTAPSTSDIALRSRISRSRVPRRGQRQRLVHDDGPSDSDDEVVVLNDVVPRPHGSARARRRAPQSSDAEGVIIVSDDDEEGPSQIRTMGRHARLRASFTSDESEQEGATIISDDEELSIRGMGRHARIFARFTSDEESEQEHSGEEDGNNIERTYENDGSISGPSSRLMRMMQEPDVDLDDDDEEED